MQNVTLRYGIEQITRGMPLGTTIGQLKADPNLRAALGYGDNVKFLIHGVEMGNEVQVPEGATVVVETACNSKA